MYNWGVALSDMARLLKELQAHQQQQQQQQMLQQQLQQQAQQQQADADKEQAQARQPSVTAAGGGGTGAAAGAGTGTGSNYQREALECLQQASHKYAESLDLQPGNPQALNNWGLVLQVRRWHGHFAAAVIPCGRERYMNYVHLNGTMACCIRMTHE